MKRFSFNKTFAILILVIIVVIVLTVLFFGSTQKDPLSEFLDDDQLIDQSEFNQITDNAPIDLEKARLEFLEENIGEYESDFAELDNNLPVWGSNFAIYKIDSDQIEYLVLVESESQSREAALFLADYSVWIENDRIVVTSFDSELANSVLGEGI